jgi:hypothetical protein
MPYVQITNPYYVAAVRDYVAVPYPTGDTVTLFSDDGEIIAGVSEPGAGWAHALSETAVNTGYPELTADAIESLDQSEVFE